jgi:hypothetical protein
VHAGLALGVHSAAQPLRPELVVRDLAGGPFFRIGAEQLNVVSNRLLVFGFEFQSLIEERFFGEHGNQLYYLYRD